jgi:predicted nuclease with TOPRIM domain
MSMARLRDGQYDENNKEVLKDLISKQRELCEAHTYIKQLQKQNQLLEARLAKLEIMVTRLSDR